MLKVFKQDFLTTVKSFSLIDNLVNNFSQTAKLQRFNPEDYLVGSHLLQVQAADV